MSCGHQCEQNGCPFVSDPQRPSRYVCLKCGLQRDIDEGRNTLAIPFVVLAGFALLALLSSRPNLGIPNPVSPKPATFGDDIQPQQKHSFDRRDRVN